MHENQCVVGMELNGTLRTRCEDDASALQGVAAVDLEQEDVVGMRRRGQNGDNRAGRHVGLRD
jgi:hypothetical protein